MIKKIIQNFIRIIQKILITISLIIVYIVGFGVTLIFAMVFNRRLLGEECKEKSTFWIKAKWYGADINDSVRQS